MNMHQKVVFISALFCLLTAAGQVTAQQILDSVNANVQGRIEDGIVITSLKELVINQEDGIYTIKAQYVREQDAKKLIFIVEEDGYIIPVQLIKRDLGAAKRFHSLGLQPGDSLTISGRLSKIHIHFEDYFGLVEAAIIETVADTRIKVKPSFKGGDANEFAAWVNKNLRYPATARESCVQGRVILQFTIKADGSVTDVTVLRGVDTSLDREAVRSRFKVSEMEARSHRWAACKCDIYFPRDISTPIES